MTTNACIKHRNAYIEAFDRGRPEDALRARLAYRLEYIRHRNTRRIVEAMREAGEMEEVA